MEITIKEYLKLWCFVIFIALIACGATFLIHNMAPIKCLLFSIKMVLIFTISFLFVAIVIIPLLNWWMED